MAPRTYLRKQVPVRTTKSAMAINTLLAKNMAIKCHSKGLHINNSVLCIDNSVYLHKSDDTFSRLANGENFNDVIFASSKAPYESFLSCSTVDIPPMLSGSNSQLGYINHSCKNDACMSRSLMLIESWEEQKVDFVTQRKKNKRKAVGNIVKAKTFAKFNKATRPYRISPDNSNLNIANTNKTSCGIRTSKRLIEKVVNGFSNQDASLSVIILNRSRNCISPLAKTAEPESNSVTGFEKHIMQSSRSLTYDHNNSMKNEKQFVSVPEICSQNVSKSFLRFANNSTCDNNNFSGLKHSTPFLIRAPSHKHLGELIGTSPRMTRQSRAKKQLQLNKTDNCNGTNTDLDISRNSPIKRRSRGRPPKIAPKIDEVTYDLPLVIDISEIPKESIRITRSKGLPKIESKFSVLLENSPKSNRKMSLKNFLHDNNSISSRTRSRSLGQIESTHLSMAIIPDKLSKASIRICNSVKLLRSKSVGRPRKSISRVLDYSTEEQNKENVPDPFKQVTQRRKTVGRKYQRPNRNEVDNKSLTLRDVPACSMKNIYRMSPMLTRLQKKIILKSFVNTSDSNENTKDLRCENTPITNRSIKNCIIKQESTEDEVNMVNLSTEYNYSIEDVTSPTHTTSNESAIDCPSVSIQNFKPKYQGTPKKTNSESKSGFRNSTLNGSCTQENASRIFSKNDESAIQRVDVTSSSSLVIVENIEKSCPLVEPNAHSEDAHSEHLCINNIKQEFRFPVPMRPLPRMVYAPGKGYRRSILAARETYHENEYANATNNSNHNEQRRSSIRLIPLSLQQSISGGNNTVFDEVSGTPQRPQQDQKSLCLRRSSIRPRAIDIDDRLGSILNESITEVEAQTAKDIVLRNCGQENAEEWSAFYPDSLLKNCWKIGEGVYGEVFMFRNVKNTVSVMKVIPIEGDQIVNCEPQKKFQDILSEIIIAKKLSSLTTPGFNRLESVHLINGAYPELLLEQWRLYDEANGSENDCPDTFQTASQLYLILQLHNGGKDLESYEFKNAVESYSIFVQICHSLAQAEHYYSFEHRDLHWGNVLISPCPKDTTLTYTLPTTSNNNNDDQDATEHTYTVDTHGVQCNIIDFTLSRMTVPCAGDVVSDVKRKGRRRSESQPHTDYVLYNDLSVDPELFNGEGDPQFDVYRQMRKETGDDWSQFCPKNNVYWLSYILQKMLTEVNYCRPESRIHRSFLSKMRRCRSRIHLFANCADVVKSLH